ncbi:GTP cyclohydrolase II [Photobacterium alginatilyticum]|uniref:GTP cyclohydrolase-2 n=1 Tax=Photobacterium alginatilyticum TaxID=1775171 RepID=A0ABW9YKX9_9GAMM|nr:GTP cyclohydrolase II [Photobacterium alginatilyticum]NBI54070.1 GTP cyclohydrolase II [Photobacterium alginatilyticum]
MVDEIQFYEPTESHGFLSNFASSPITLSDIVWPTSEHYYQAQKFVEPEIQQQILKAETPDQAFSLSRQYADKVKEDWMDVRTAVMRFIVFEKFRQNPRLAHLLVSTGDSVIKEHSHKDDFWGDGGDGSGRNELGKILMDVREYFAKKEPFNLVHFVDSAKLPTQWGTFQMYGFIEQATGKEHLALVYGELDPDAPPLIRLHSECLTGDALFSARCDCGFQLSRAMENIVNAGSGVLFYLRQEGRGIGLINKIRAYHLQDDGADTVEANERLGFAADMRDYSFCRGMLSFLNIKSVKLMTNNPRKVKALTSAGINIEKRVPLQEGNNPHNENYLKTKASKLGHMFDEEFIK